MSNILITRPVDDTARLSEALHVMGHHCLRDPMLTIHPLPAAVQQLAGLSLDRFQAIVITSKHALCALKHPAAWSHLPLYAVGPSSAAAARRAGFSSVHVGAAGVQQLAGAIRQQCLSTRGDILYLRGQQISQPLQPLLNDYNIQEIICYRSIASTALQPATAEAIAHDALDMALFFSRQSASIFQRLLGARRMNASALCLSAQVAGALDASGWQQISIASQPSLQAMMTLVSQHHRETSHD